MSSSQKFKEFVPEAGPSNAPLSPPPFEISGDKIDLSSLPVEDRKEESTNNPHRAADDQIASQIEKSEVLPSYADLLQSGEVRDPKDGLKNLSHLNVDVQLAKFCGHIALQRFNELKAKRIHIPLNTFIEQSINMHKILIVIRLLITELQLSDDTYLYLQTAAEYLGCQMLVKYAILKKDPLLFRDNDGNWPPIRLVQDDYMKLWFKLAQMLTNPDFTP
ncbi:hypothetical protein ABW20_dc0105439 [Dactylellina cionopaga]|nr:hypothetical protein ABW20_dc0105439 [Dactylellina cionopaga]